MGAPASSGRFGLKRHIPGGDASHVAGIDVNVAPLFAPGRYPSCFMDHRMNEYRAINQDR